MSPHPVERPEFKFWYTSSDERSLMFIQNLKHYIASIISDIDFKPQTVNWQCPHCDSEFKAKNCISDGKYCANVKDGSLQYGKEVLMEDLRQQCAWKQSEVHMTSHYKFFQYIQRAHDLCPGATISRKCHIVAMKGAQLDLQKNDECVKATFASNGEIAYKDDENLLF